MSSGCLLFIGCISSHTTPSLPVTLWPRSVVHTAFSWLFHELTDSEISMPDLDQRDPVGPSQATSPWGGHERCEIHPWTAW